jgi:GNAT superfamily N-acetyltransferase
VSSAPDPTFAEDFDRAFIRRAHRLAIRPETEADSAFLSDLFARCSPMRDVLPAEMLAAQWRLQNESHRAAHPAAMRRIILAGDTPIARIVVDWTPADHSHGVDITVDPDWRSVGGGMPMLRAWLDVADAWGRPCRLTVLAANPARRIYERLGFRAEQDFADGAPLLVMTRQVGPRPSTSGTFP